MKNKQSKSRVPPVQNQNHQGAVHLKNLMGSPTNAQTPAKLCKKMTIGNECKKGDQRQKSTDFTTPHKGHTRVASSHQNQDGPINSQSKNQMHGALATERQSLGSQLAPSTAKKESRYYRISEGKMTQKFNSKPKWVKYFNFDLPGQGPQSSLLQSSTSTRVLLTCPESLLSPKNEKPTQEALKKPLQDLGTLPNFTDCDQQDTFRQINIMVQNEENNTINEIQNNIETNGNIEFLNTDMILRTASNDEYQDQELFTSGQFNLEVRTKEEQQPESRSSLIEEMPQQRLLVKPISKPMLDMTSNSKLTHNMSSNSDNTPSFDPCKNSKLFIQPMEEKAKFIFTGYKVRRILKGKRLRHLINRIQSLKKDLDHAQKQSHNVRESFTVKQIDIQLKRKKELFINTLNEILQTPHWYTACQISESIANRKRQIMKSRLNKNPLNKSLIESFCQNDDELFDHQLVKESRDDNIFYYSNSQSQNNLQIFQQHNDDEEQNASPINNFNNLNQILNENYTSSQSVRSNQKNRVKFVDEVHLEETKEDIKKEENIENIIISFAEIYEKEKQRFKQMRSERSSSREQNFKDRSFDHGIRYNRQSSKEGLSQSFAQDSYRKSKSPDQDINMGKNGIIVSSQNHSAMMFSKKAKTQQSKQNDIVQIAFKKKVQGFGLKNALLNIQQDVPIGSSGLSVTESNSSKPSSVYNKPAIDTANNLNSPEYYNKLKTKYVKVGSRIDCWRDSNSKLNNEQLAQSISQPASQKSSTKQVPTHQVQQQNQTNSSNSRNNQSQIVKRESTNQTHKNSIHSNQAIYQKKQQSNHQQTVLKSSRSQESLNSQEKSQSSVISSKQGQQGRQMIYK